MYNVYNDQIQSTREYNGVIHAFKKIFQNEGFVGFFKGYPVSMFSMPATFLYLTTLEVNHLHWIATILSCPRRHGICFLPICHSRMLLR